MWKEFSACIPHGLQRIARQLQSTIIGSRADTTIRSYVGGFKRWKRWAVSNGIPQMPANPFHVAMYLQCLLNDARSPSPIRTAVYSIDWAMQLAGLAKVGDHPLVLGLVHASHRILGKPTVKKEPVTPEMLKALVKARLANKCPSLSDIRMVALCLIGYAGFFRFSELSSIKSSDVKFFPSYVSIFLESSKTDQFRQGAWIVIARSGLPTCPWKALEQYIAAAKIDLSDHSPLFRSLLRSKDSRVRGITYTRAREVVKEAFKGLTDVSKIAVHSLRSGAQPQLRMLVYKTECLNGMVVGLAKMRRTDMLKII